MKSASRTRPRACAASYRCCQRDRPSAGAPGGVGGAVRGSCGAVVMPPRYLDVLVDVTTRQAGPAAAASRRRPGVGTDLAEVAASSSAGSGATCSAGPWAPSCCGPGRRRSSGPRRRRVVVLGRSSSKSSASRRTLRSSRNSCSSSCGSRAPRPKPPSTRSRVARSITSRPDGVIAARVPRPSAGLGLRSTSPCAARRWMMLVALVGWTMSRSPTLLIGRRPSRLKASSTSAS